MAMRSATARQDRVRQPRAGGSIREILTAISMTVGRSPAARAVAAAVELAAADRVVDIGCGPGMAVREAAGRGATATGVDPAPAMLRLASWIGAVRRPRGIAWVAGGVEQPGLPSDSATVVWAISSVHHWQDRAAGLRQISRVLAPGGRLLLVERLTKPGARGHAAHGLTSAQAEDLASQTAAAGFTGVRISTTKAGHRQLIIIQGTRGTSG